MKWLFVDRVKTVLKVIEICYCLPLGIKTASMCFKNIVVCHLVLQLTICALEKCHVIIFGRKTNLCVLEKCNYLVFGLETDLHMFENYRLANTFENCPSHVNYKAS